MKTNCNLGCSRRILAGLKRNGQHKLNRENPGHFRVTDRVTDHAHNSYWHVLKPRACLCVGVCTQDTKSHVHEKDQLITNKFVYIRECFYNLSDE